MNFSKLPCVLTGEVGKARVAQVCRQKCICIYRNEAVNKLPLNVRNTACSLTGV